MRNSVLHWRRPLNWRPAASLCVTLAIGLVGAGSVQAQVTLKPQVQPGKTTKSVTDLRINQTLSIAGMEQESTDERTVTSVTTAGPKAADESITAHTKIDSMKVNTSVGGMTLQFDSTNPEATGDAGALAIVVDLLKAIAATEYDTKFGKDGRVAEVKITSNAAASISPEARPLYEGSLNGATLRDEANTELDRLPKGPVKPGDQWEVTNKVSFGMGQSMSFQEVHVFKGEETVNGKKGYRVDVTANTATFAIDAAGGLPVTVKSSDLKIAESKGHYSFDPAAGATTESANKLRVQGDIVLVINGMELPGKLDLTMDAKNRVE